MGLKALLDSLDGVDDAVRGLYKPGEGGRFVLDVDDVDKHPTVRNLKSAFDTQKGELTEAKGKLSGLEARLGDVPEDFDPAKWHEFKAGNKGDRDVEIVNLTKLHEAKLAAIAAKHAADLRERDEAIQNRDSILDRTARDTELTNLLIGANVNKSLFDGAKSLLAEKIKTVRGEDGKRTNIVPTNLGDLSLSEYVKAWSEDQGKGYIEQPTGPRDVRGGGHGGAMRVSRADFDKMHPSQKAELAAKVSSGQASIIDGPTS